MAYLDSVVIETLNRLLVTCQNSAYGFRLAAAYVQNPDLRTVLQEYSQQRQTCVLTLQTTVAHYGGIPATTGTVAASLHRGWISLKSLLSSYDDQVVLIACEQGEQDALRIYNEALQQNPPLPDQAYLLTVQQQRWIQETLAYIETLKPASLLEAVV